MRFPCRFFVLVALALALLAGKGFGRIAAGGPGRRRGSVLSLIAMAWSASLSVVFLWALVDGRWALDLIARATDHPSRPVVERALEDLGSRGLQAQVLLFVTAALVWAVCRGWLRRRAFVALGIAVLTVDLLMFGAGVNFRTDRSFFDRVPRAAQIIQADAGHPGLIRVHREPRPQDAHFSPPGEEKEWICLWERQLLFPSTGIQYRLGYDLLATADLLSPKSTALAARLMTRGGESSTQLMRNLCSVEYVLGFSESLPEGLSPIHRVREFSRDFMTVSRNSQALPRARLVAMAVPVESGSAFDQVLAEEFDPHQQVVLTADRSELVGDGDSGVIGASRPPGRCQIVTDEASRVVVAVDSLAPAWLVLADSFFPGWRAEVDGQVRPIYEANGLHRAVRVEPGDREVVFEYRPRSWRLGLYVSTASAGTLVLMLFFCTWVRIRSAPGRSAGTTGFEGS